jgi:riboflavin synthase
MFTGIVHEVGTLERSEPRGAGGAQDRRVAIAFAAIAPERLELGASIAVDGVCLTVAALHARSFEADVSGETLRVTTLGTKRTGGRVNLEPSLRAGDSLGGHWVSGHVDGTATVLSVAAEGRSRRIDLAAPAPLARYIARKGSVTLDGVSLTVNDVAETNFSINLIPHTLEVTTLGALEAGARVNLEIDLLARYVERLSSTPGSSPASMPGSSPGE